MIYSGFTLHCKLWIGKFDGKKNERRVSVSEAYIYTLDEWNLIRAGWIRSVGGNLDLSRDFFERLSGSWSSNISIVFDWIMGQLRGEA